MKLALLIAAVDPKVGGVLALIFIKALHLQTHHPTPGYLAINLVYSYAAAVLGGWVAAKVAGYRLLEHGIALGLLMLIGGLLFLIHPPEGQPLWYGWVLTLASPPLAVLGAALARRT